MITFERWATFTARDQIGHIGAEILRASKASIGGHEKIRRSILKRASFLIELSLQDPKWQENKTQILFLRDEIGKASIGEEVDLGRLYDAL